MSLVAYDSSDDSEEEKSSKSNLSSVLNAHPKNQKEIIKIRIPSLKEFEDDEEDILVKKPKLQPGSGLFSLLPPPKNISTLGKPGFMPHILKSKTEMTAKERKDDRVKAKMLSPAFSEEQDSDEEDSSVSNKSNRESADVSTKSDFFWLDDLASNNESDKASNFSLSSEKETFLQSLPSSSGTVTESPEKETEDVCYQPQFSEFTSLHANRSSTVDYSFSNTERAKEGTQESLLADKEFLKLRGRRREFENVDIIDVNADDQLTDKREWLMRNLTKESMHRSSRKRHNLPTQQQKRKHQITYLAFQAKEREMDLKNQWSLNSSTRRETQAKYGF